MLPTLQSSVAQGEWRVRQNSVWALTRLAQQAGLSAAATAALRLALQDDRAELRQAACLGLSRSVSPVDPDWLLPLLDDWDAGVRRQAATTLGMLGHAAAVARLLASLERDGIDRAETHALVYAMIEIGDVEAIRRATASLSADRAGPGRWRAALLAIDQIGGERAFDEMARG
jgi:HEAT repeat protein